MKKDYIKLNNNDEHLSLGNLFRIIKELSKNKTSAMQTEIFCSLFDVEDINDTTVNNYCVGCRSIGSAYKQIFINYEKKYQTNNKILTSNIIRILNIIDGKIYIVDDEESLINNNQSAENLSKILYNIAKNDSDVEIEFTNKLHRLIEDKKYYNCLVEEFFFIVLEKKQPQYEDELKKKVIENVLNDTSISSSDLQEYLTLKLREGINFEFSMKQLAAKGNAYANFELGSNEYYGYVSGKPRYDKAYYYLKESAKMNHAPANYMIGNMFTNGLIGNKSKTDLQTGYEYLTKSAKLGNIAALNSIGNMYKEGTYPLEKNIDKAIEYYKQASDNNYVYAYNNLGKIEENNSNYEKAYEYYRISADLGESWACNKMGEYYRKQERYMQAFEYYNKSLDNNYHTLCYYAYYNLAKYFYLNGCSTVVLTSDKNKSIEYFKIASNHNIIEASIELIKIFIKDYLATKDNNIYKEILSLKNKIESNNKYSPKVKEEIEKEINSIKNENLLKIEI